MNSRIRRAAVLFLLVSPAVVLCTFNPASGQSYVLTDLGVLPGDQQSKAYAIDEAGAAVGVSMTAGSAATRAILQSNGRTADLGSLGGAASIAYDVNSSGIVVGKSRTSGDADRAYRYDSGSMTDLGTLGGMRSYAYGINDAGFVVGQSQTSSGLGHAFLHDGMSMMDLGTLGGSISSAQKINGFDEVAGFSSIAGDTAVHAFLWTSGGGMQDLGTLGGTHSHAYDVSDTGEVVGSSQIAGDGATHAFVWTSGGGFVDLGTLGGSSAVAYGVNAAGQIVGTSITASGNSAAFLHDGGSMIDLNDTIPGQLGWSLERAADVNEAGQIVGYGLKDGQRRAFLLTPCSGANDCNANGLPDSCDIANAVSLDCNANAVPDECDIAGGTSIDCNLNGIADGCEVARDPVFVRIAQESSPGSGDFDANVLGFMTAYRTALPANDYYFFEGAADFAAPEPVLLGDRTHLFVVETAEGTSLFVVHGSLMNTAAGNAAMRFEISGDPDGAFLSVEDDAGEGYSGAPGDSTFTASHTWSANRTDGLVLSGLDGPWSATAEFTSTPSSITTWAAYSSGGPTTLLTIEAGRRVRMDVLAPDCNGNSVPDDCDLAGGTSADCNANDIPDACEADCNANGFPDDCDVTAGTSDDCNANNIPDACDLAGTAGGLTAIIDFEGFLELTLIRDQYERFGVTFSLEGDPDAAPIIAVAGSPAVGFVGPPGDDRPMVSGVGGLTDPDTGTAQNIVVDFSPPVYQASLYVIDLDSSDSATLRAYDGMVEVDSDTRSSSDPDAGDGVATLLEVSAPNITRIVLEVSPSNIGYGVDDLSFTRASTDCNANGVLDECDIDSGMSGDCDGDFLPDECEPDCNANAQPDDCDILDGVSSDCNDDRIPDECELAAGSAGDCDMDGSLDSCDIRDDATPCRFPTSLFRNTTGFSGFFVLGPPDDLQTGLGNGQVTYEFDCGFVYDGLGPDLTVYEYDVSGSAEYSLVEVLVSQDGLRYFNIDATETAAVRVPGDESHNLSFARSFDLAPSGFSTVRYVRLQGTDSSAPGGFNGFDLDAIGAVHIANDCNLNGLPDNCDIDSGFSADCNANGIPDECEYIDCNTNGIPDDCDIAGGTSGDCDANGRPDECDIGGVLSTFDTDAEGWTVDGGPITHMTDGGNPGGWISVNDSVGNTLTIFAPPAFTGDLLRYDGGEFSFDGREVSNPNPPSSGFGTVTIASGTLSVSLDIVADDPTTEWQSYSVSLTASQWGLSQEEWTELLSDVTQLSMNLEFGSGTGETAGLDNFELFAATDCNTNGRPDDCDIQGGTSTDFNANDLPDECEDCNGNGLPDELDLAGNDCNTNGVPDECDLDCDTNGIPDACELDPANLIPDGSFDLLEASTKPDCGEPAGGWFWPAAYESAAICEDLAGQYEIVPTASFDPGTCGNSLRLDVDNRPSDNYHLIYQVDRIDEAPQQIISLTFDVWVIEPGVAGGAIYAGGDHGGGGYDFNTDRGPQLAWRATGILTADNNTPPEATAYQPGVWQRLRVDMDLVDDTYDLWWAEQEDPLALLGEDLIFRSPNLNHVDRVTVTHFGGEVTNRAYFDNFTLRVLADCNSNGKADDIDIALGTSADGDQNGIPDECEGFGLDDPASLPGELHRPPKEKPDSIARPVDIRKEESEDPR